MLKGFVIILILGLLETVAFAQEDVMLVTGVDLERLLSDSGVGAVTLEMRTLIGIPNRVFYKFGSVSGEILIAIGVYPTIEKAQEVFKLAIARTSVRPMLDAQGNQEFGDEAASWPGHKRIDFRRKNVWASIMCCRRNSDPEACRRKLAAFLDNALEKKCPKAKVVPVPKTKVIAVRRERIGPQVKVIADIEVREADSPLLVANGQFTGPPVTTYSVEVTHPEKPIVLATRTNVVFEVVLPPVQDGKPAAEKKATEKTGKAPAPAKEQTVAPEKQIEPSK